MAAAPPVTFETCDWTSKDSIVGLLPVYLQVQYDSRKNNRKPLPKSIDIETFTLKTPYGDQTLLKNTELHLEPNKKQALIGRNNSGKSLLFHYMATGQIKDLPKHIHIHHCKELEVEELKEKVTVKDMVLNSHPYMNLLRKCEEKIEQLIDELDEGENKEAKGDSKAEEIQSRREALNESLEFVKFYLNSIHADTAEERVAKMLRILGFDDQGQQKFVTELSGGLKMRVALAMAFFIEPDFLLLDEPTNHLDFPSVLWLENRLRGYKGSFLLVSHDRELLNNVCTSILLLEDQAIKYYQCGFKEFEKRKSTEDQKKYEDIEKFLQKNPNPDPSTMLGRDRADKKAWYDAYFAKQVALAGKFTFNKFVPLEAKEVDAEGKPVPQDKISLIKVDNVRFSYKPEQESPVFIFHNPISYTVTPSTRVGLLGPNGAGKSTFLKLITHKLTATNGAITQHPKLTIAYFGQHSTAELDLEMTPIEFLQREFPKESTGALRNHLTKTSITGTTQDTRMKALSFSQRSCIVFAKLTFLPSALLIMDEPTNFLDLESVDSLIAASRKYPGALILVSHNRDFLRKCATEYLSVVPGKFAVYPDLKSAERATYTFIAEMEEGGGSGGIGKNALANNPGGGSVQAFQGVAEAKTPVAATPAATTTTTAAPAATAAPAQPAGPVKIETYKEKEKCLAKWTDGKFYAAVIKKVLPGDKYALTYTEYGNTTTLHASAMKKAPAAAPKK